MSLLTATHGRAFVLFTSRAAMLRATQTARSELTLPILCQGEAPDTSYYASSKATKEPALWNRLVLGGSRRCRRRLVFGNNDRLPFDPDDQSSRPEWNC